MKKLCLLVLLFNTWSVQAMSFDTMKHINRGQTEAEVLLIAGQPDNRSYAGHCSVGIAYQWLYLKREGDDRNVLVTFCSGKVATIDTPGWR